MKQIITEPEFVERSKKLEDVLGTGTYKEYCLERYKEHTDEHKRYIWQLLDAYFEGNMQADMVNVLGKTKNPIF